ncbi:hemolysin D [Aliiroseovarius zhejiangensis]|uniref:Hemolysin D n=1 Tax=Aliiroseovarius zhejiangensis TaxID=1632025 RepID=A0ABQ3IMC2_9RHOB|nr:efflux RND transporter periplasmic adaptor subunit [Aliiroseovarius zhejiangensis]GHE86701.1 hemolysin D [Aliiroseovarius zhejiangensis]
MRLFPILTAIIVVAGLYLLVFQRDTLETAAGTPPTEAGADSAAPTGETTSQADRGVSVVALRSTARAIEMPVLLRGRTEANRRVELRSETTGQVISAKIAKGSTVDEGDILCQLDAGTREASLAEATARLAEARARAPEADARVIEAQARLDEAMFNLTAATKLSEGGFASDTRVANTRAAVEAARAAFVAAQSGAASSAAAIQSAEAAVAAAEREIERLDIRAPFPGTLETDTADLGTLMQPGAVCATVVQYDPVRVVGYVSELQVDKLTTGLPAEVRLAAGAELTGHVTFVADTADPITRTFRVEVQITRPDDAAIIRAGQTAEVVITGNGLQAHLVPQSALTLDDDGQLGVRIVADGGVAGFAPVTMVRDSNDGVWITGLPATAEVIVVGHHYVSDGVALDLTYREPGI